MVKKFSDQQKHVVDPYFSSNPSSGMDAGLYIVATPIGNARDITLRAIDVLSAADILVAEDTRNLRKLMSLHDISLSGRSLVSYHDKSRKVALDRIIDALHKGKAVAYCSDAGTPLVADPGYELVRNARIAELPVHILPGASAVMAALSAAGLATDRFYFEGFLPASQTARRKRLEALASLEATLVVFESPRRIRELIEDAAEMLGAERETAICREMTKKFEEVIYGTLGDILDRMHRFKGEFTVLIDRRRSCNVPEVRLVELLQVLVPEMGTKEAAITAAKELGVKRGVAYAEALRIRSNSQD